MVSCCIKSVVKTGTDERDLDWDLDLGIGVLLKSQTRGNQGIACMI